MRGGSPGPKSYHQITRSFVDGDELKLGEYNTAAAGSISSGGRGRCFGPFRESSGGTGEGRWSVAFFSFCWGGMLEWCFEWVSQAFGQEFREVLFPLWKNGVDSG